VLGFSLREWSTRPMGQPFSRSTAVPEKRLILRHSKDPEVRPGLVLRPKGVGGRLAKVRREVNDSL
jgi:hypothetical protein